MLNPKEQYPRPWEKFYKKKTPSDIRLTTGAMIDNYFRSNDFKRLKPKTRGLYFTAVNKLNTLSLTGGKQFLHTPAWQIDFSAVEYIKNVLLYEMAETSLAVYFSVMGRIWYYSQRQNFVFMNPWEKPNLKRTHERDLTWTIEQVNTVCNTAKEMGFHTLAQYVILMYETAQRPWKDLRNLKWDNFKELDGKKVLDFVISKTNTHVIMPLSDRAIEALSGPRTSEYIFSEASGERPTGSCIQQQFNTVKERTGLPKDLWFRDLRRTALTELAESGCTTAEIEAVTGWRVPDAVMRKYVRVRYKTAVNAHEKRQAARANTQTGTIP